MYKKASKIYQLRIERAAQSDIKKATKSNKKKTDRSNKKQDREIPSKFKRAFKCLEFIRGRIIEEIKGGYQINFDGFIAFCPYSEMYPRFLSSMALNKLKQQSLEFLVIRINLSSVVVSRRQAAHRLAWKNVKEAFYKKTLISGVVKDIKEYGAFIDLGGIDGLLHISEIHNERINNISDFLHKGKALKVAILSFNERNNRVALSLRLTIQSSPAKIN